MALADGVSFQAASAGTGTFVFGTARASFVTLAQAVTDGELVDGQTVSYLAQDSLSAPTQREWGHGIFHAAGSGSITRTSPFVTVNGNTVATATPLNFSVAPYVSLTVLAEDLAGLSSLTLTDGTNTVADVAQITVAGGTVGGTTPDATLTINTRIILTGNLSLSVTPTGHDTGTVGPFLTIGYAAGVAESYDYNFLYAPTISVADGTYNEGVVLPELINCPLGGTLVGDTTTPTSCIIANTSGDAINTSPFAIWSVSGFRLKSTSGTGHDLLAQNYSTVTIAHIDFAGNNILCMANNFTDIYAVTTGLTSSTASAACALSVFSHAQIVNDGQTWTFNNSPNFTDYVIRVSDQSLIGTGTFVNGNTVTGNRLFMFGYSYFEYTSDRSTLPGNGTVHIDQPSYFGGDSNVVLGGYQNTSASITGTIVIADGVGNVQADFGITNAGDWNFNGQNPVFTSANTAYSGFVVNNTTTGAHELNLFTVGSAGISGLVAGEGGLFDLTAGNVPIWWDASSNVNFWGTLGWGASSGGSFSVPTIDTGLSRTAAGVLAIGTGAAGSHAGSLLCTDVTTNDAAALIKTGTTLNSGASTHTGTLTNAPAATNPTKWIPINDNGTTRYVPAW